MRNQRKRRKIIKRLISGVSAIALSVGLLGSIPASADDSNAGYKYTLFAYSSEDGAISSSAANFCVNGNIATNGTISAGQNFNVNGEKKEHANEVMPNLSKAINEKFFAENVDVKAENYKNEDVNINVASPLDVKGKAELNGNIKLAAGVKAMGDISFAGGVLNNDNTVLFSENGSININSENVSLTGLIYAPKGNIVIESKSLNLNSVVMIANKITLNAPNININNSASMAKFVQESIDKNGNNNTGDEPEPEPVTDPAIYAYGEYNEETKSVDIEWYSNVTGEFAVLESMNGTDYTLISKVSDATKYSIKVASDFIKKFYKVTIIKDGKTIESIPFAITKATGKYTTELLDTDKDGLADLYEEMLGTDKTLPDTDKDGLTDYEEVYITNTDPTKYDSVTEGVSDADADNDKDGLTNKKEIEIKTDPNSDDTDGDTLKDGDEVNKYNTDPIKRDTDGDDLEDDDELKFNFDPNKKDTDNNGIIDGKEKHQQTLDVIPDNKEQAVTKVSVSMAASGNIEKTTTVESIMDKDVLCSNVVGLVGEPFSIESESSFDKATITFTVDKTKLGETEFDNLMFLWYDRENDNFVELETSHDAVNSTVSVETTHFSEYMIVDSKMWFDNWRQIEEERKRLSSEGSSTLHVIKPTDTAFVMCCSDSSDPFFFNSDEYSSTVYTYTNYRTLICKHLISSLSDYGNDTDTNNRQSDGLLFASLEQSGLFTSTAWAYGKNNSNIDVMSRFYRSNSERYELIREFKEKGYYIDTDDQSLWFPDDYTKKQIIYFVDRDITKDFTCDKICGYRIIGGDKGNIYHGYDKSVPVYFVCVGNFDRTNLEDIAEETGGRVYTVVTSSDIYKFYSDSDSHFDPYLVDSDDDGLTDYEEMAGFYTSNCGKLYTDPQNPDTDGDGIKDGDEFLKKIIKVEASATAGKDIYKCYSILLSDPTKKDTDDDGYFDKNDPRPSESDVIIKRLKHDYIEVDYTTVNETIIDEKNKYINHLGKDERTKNISYGGNQGWFRDLLETEKSNIIAEQGCGLIAAADLVLYLSRKNDSYSNSLTNMVPRNNPIPFEDYKKFVLLFDQAYIGLFIVFSTDDITINSFDLFKTYALNLYFEDYGIKLKANWGILENGIFDAISLYSLSLRARRIKEMIENDFPAIISVGDGDGVSKYDINTNDSFLGNGIVYEKNGGNIHNHFFTVTGIIEDKIKLEKGDPYYLMYEISSWGQKYYVSELEIRRDNDSRFFTIATNVMYLEDE